MREIGSFEFGEFRLEPEKLRLCKGSEVVAMSPKALEILVLLVENRHRTVARDEIMTAVWSDTFVEEGNINFQISNLRKTLGQNGKAESQYITTIPKSGYRFVADVRESVRTDVGPDGADTVSAGFAANANRGFSFVGLGLLIALIGGGITVASNLIGRPNVPLQSSAVNAELLSTSPEANAFYIQGKKVWNSRVFSIQDPGELFLKAIEADPSFARAHLALADTYAFDATPERAENAVTKAAELDPNMPGLDATRGFIRMFHYWDWAGAEELFEKAIARSGSDAKSRHWYGVLLSLTGRNEEAVEQMRAAQMLDPSSMIIAADIGQLYYFAGRNEEAREHLEQVLKIDPRFPMARRYLSNVYIQSGDEAKAFEEIQNARQKPSEVVYDEREVFLSKGMRGIWERQANVMDRTKPGTGYECASVLVRLGRNEEALTELERAMAERDFQLPFINADPVWNGVRSDPRFTAILSAMGLSVQP